jgi:hypothetical protein
MDNKLLLKLEGPSFNREEGYRVSALLARDVVSYGQTVLEVAQGNTSFPVMSPCEGYLLSFLVKEGDEVRPGDPIAEIFSASLSPSYSAIEEMIDKKIWNLAIATNAVFKGLLGSMGASGQIASRTVPIKVELPTNNGVDALLDTIAEACDHEGLEEGDVVVLAEKPFAVAQKRLVPLTSTLYNVSSVVQ